MRIGIAFAIVVAGCAASVYAAHKLVRPRDAEALERWVTSTLRRVVTMVGFVATGVAVMALWTQANTEDIEDNNRANCEAIRVTQQQIILGDIADVRIARAQYQAAVNELIGIENDLRRELPDFSSLDQAEQDFVRALIADSRARLEQRREDQAQEVTDLEVELATREDTLDRSRATQIESCPTRGAPTMPSSTTG